MKYTLLFLALATASFAARPTKAEEITYELLVKTGQTTGYCDHAPHIRKIFENYKVKTLFEFGLGYSTKYFLDNCTKVISVEFVTLGDKPDWIKYCLDLYKGYSNWVPVAYFSSYTGDFSWAPYKFFGTAKFWEASLHYIQTNQDPPDSSYLTELQTFIGNLTKYNKVDLALVDPISTLRGPIVQLLFDKAPIILAGDCESFVNLQCGDIYRYRKVITPDNYERIYIPKGKGTLLWIKKSDETNALIQIMKDYAESP